jgi:hypothetical protein
LIIVSFRADPSKGKHTAINQYFSLSILQRFHGVHMIGPFGRNCQKFKPNEQGNFELIVHALPAMGEVTQFIEDNGYKVVGTEEISNSKKKSK